MKRPFSIVLLFVFLSSCSILRQPIKIEWPEERFGYMAALCELDVAWRGLNYSGQMSLLIDYPDRLRVEVYSPFGDTVVYIERDDKHFLFIGSDEKVSNEEEFKERFGIDLKGLIDDILLIGVYQKAEAKQCVEKNDYRVIYMAHGDADKMCIEDSKVGANRICIKFVEVSFDRQATKATNPSQ